MCMLVVVAESLRYFLEAAPDFGAALGVDPVKLPCRVLHSSYAQVLGWSARAVGPASSCSSPLASRRSQKYSGPMVSLSWRRPWARLRSSSAWSSWVSLVLLVLRPPRARNRCRRRRHALIPKRIQPDAAGGDGRCGSEQVGVIGLRRCSGCRFHKMCAWCRWCWCCRCVARHR